MNINQLSEAKALAAGDLLAVWQNAQGDTRKASLTSLTGYLQTALSLPNNLLTQYAAPSSTGFSVAVSASNTWLLLTPTATFAAGTIVLPTGPADRTEVKVSSTQIVTDLTVSADATVTGEPTTLAANDFFTMRYDGGTSAWYRVG